MYDNAVEELETDDGYSYRIEYDENPENPRENGDYFVAVLTQLSDRFQQPDKGYDTRIIHAWQDARSHRDGEVVERYARAFLGAVAVGWWDDPQSMSRVFGYVTADAVESSGITDAQRAVDAELSEYGAWCEGDVYGYVVEAPDGEELDSCWGFYGDDSIAYLRDEINMTIQNDRDSVHAQRVALYRKLVSS